MDKRCIYRMEPEPSAAPPPKPSIPPGAPAPTPAPTVAQAVVEVSAAVVLTGIDPTDFNADPQQVEAFAQTILATLPAALAGAEVTDIVAKSARRRRLQAGSVEVEYTIVVRQDETTVTDSGASILSDITTSLSAAVSSGEFLQTLIEEAAAAGGSAAMAFMTIGVDVAASTAAMASSPRLSRRGGAVQGEVNNNDPGTRRRTRPEPSAEVDGCGDDDGTDLNHACGVHPRDGRNVELRRRHS